MHSSPVCDAPVVLHNTGALIVPKCFMKKNNSGLPVLLQQALEKLRFAICEYDESRVYS